MHKIKLIAAIFTIGAITPAFAQNSATNNNIGDGGPAIAALISSPSGIAIDSKGNIFIAERRGCRIRRIDAKTSVIATVVGTGTGGFSGDGGPANHAMIQHPELITIDHRDNLFITDRSNARIRRVDGNTGVITTVAGTGKADYTGDGGAATAASISYPFGILVDKDDNIWIADTENHVIRRVEAKTGNIHTIAGNGNAGFSGDGGAATKASLNRPHNFALDPDGNLVIGDSQNQRIRRVDMNTGVITTLYGTGEQGVSDDGGHAREARFGFFGSMLFDRAGNLLFTGWIDSRVRKIDYQTGIITTIAGSGKRGFSGDGGPAKLATAGGFYGMALDRDENIFVADVENNRIRRIDAKTNIIITIAGK